MPEPQPEKSPDASTAHPEAFPAVDVAVVGAGAAGFTAAIRAAEAGATVRLFNAHPKVGLKILMSGGTRCNVTHDRVGPESFCGGSRNSVAIVLKAFSAQEARAWFASLGVALKEEPGGKLFPVTDSARTVLDALVGKAGELGVEILAGVPVRGITPPDEGGGTFLLGTPGGTFPARAVILATGGLSFPKTGSDGSGYALVRSLGHTVSALTPALTPLVLSGEFHRRLQGVTLPAALSLAVDGKRAVTCAGSLLFTHFGLSGPAALDLSRHWLRVPEGSQRTVTAHFLPRGFSGGSAGAGPGAAGVATRPGTSSKPADAEKPGGLPDRTSLEKEWLEAARTDTKATIQTFLSRSLPLFLVRDLAAAAAVPHATTLVKVTREERRRLLDLVVAFPLPVEDALGYGKAEVTAGGVPLTEIDPRRMASRVCAGLFLAGEILDVDGRLGGYNFQWAWSSGHTAGRSAAQFTKK